jgi:hypothetical protein
MRHPCRMNGRIMLWTKDGLPVRPLLLILHP